jgi:SAM-dependent methyltransferase
MMDYWESRFKNEGEMWKFEPSDSALFALELFMSNGIKNILIPGFGYGRNAKIFLENGFSVTGIEISESAIKIAKSNGLNCPVHHGSVTSMPFDNQQFDGIFCYALIHLLNKYERRTFLKSCYNQLNKGGIMVFTITSRQMSLYGNGRYLSKDRFEISKGLKVYFYDNESVTKEFSEFGLESCSDIEEPTKFMEGVEPTQLKIVICRKR